MKAHWNKCLIAAAALVAALSCTEELSSPDKAPAREDEMFNQMSLSVSDGYDVSFAQTKAAQMDATLEQDGMIFSVHGHPRHDGQTKASYNDVVWENGFAKAGIFMIEHLSDTANLAPEDIHIFGVKGQTINRAMNGSTVEYSSNKLLGNVRSHVPGHEMEGKSVDVIGYFPYAEQISKYVPLSNVNTSILGIFDDESPETLLNMTFAMKPTQTDDNVWYHDLMVSVREDANTTEDGKLINLYGNTAKKNRSTYNSEQTLTTGYYDLEENLVTGRRAGTPNETNGTNITCDNVHLRLVHKFSLINITLNYDSRYVGSKFERLYVEGSKIFTSGTVNLITGKISHSEGATTIDRLIDKKYSTLGYDADGQLMDNITPLSTDMMVCPCVIDGEGQFVIHLVVNGTTYSCDLYKLGVPAIREGYAYEFNLSFSDTATLLVENGKGGNAQCAYLDPAEVEDGSTDYGDNTIIIENGTSYPYNKIGDKARYLVIAPNEGWELKGVYRDGEYLGTLPYREVATADVGVMRHYWCPLEITNNKNTVYRIVYRPAEKWYSRPEKIIQQFDGIYNSGFQARSTDPTVNIWKDISGRGNDAHLQNVDVGTLKDYRDYVDTPLAGGQSYENYPSHLQSGWVKGGVKLNGVNSYITFPAVLPERRVGDFGLTIDMYVLLEGNQSGTYPRLLCEAEPGVATGNSSYTVHGYPSIVMQGASANNTSATNIRQLGDATSIWYMGFGHNNGHPSNSTSGMTASTTGANMVHIVLWYKGGHGNVTDMNIFKKGRQPSQMTGTNELGGGDKRNALAMMLQCPKGQTDTLRKVIMAYYDPTQGNEGEEFEGDENEGKDFIDGLLGGYTWNEKSYQYLKYPLLWGEIVRVNGGATQSHFCFLEDPFLPSERWACIGGRPNDYTRQLNATIFSFIVYDGLLTTGEAIENYRVHKTRFGSSKTSIPAGLR